LDPEFRSAAERHVARRPFLLLLMGLAGILTVALIVSADQSYAGINGMRAVTAFAPANEQDPPAGVIPVLSGILDGIRELPLFGAPAPASPEPVQGPVTAPITPPSPTPPTPGAATPVASLVPPAPTQPAPSAPPAAIPPTATPAPTAGPTTTPATPEPTATPTPTTAPTASPTPTPTPTLQVSTDRGAVAIVTLGDLVPGDTIGRTITVKNTGALGFRYVVSASQTANTLLWTDPTNGLQLTVADSGGTVLYSGPLSGLGSLAGPGTLAAGDTELLRYSFALPASASDAFQGLVQDLTLVFTATQYP
jgi:hypothetical protein